MMQPGYDAMSQLITARSSTADALSNAIAQDRGSGAVAAGVANLKLWAGLRLIGRPKVIGS